MVQRGEKGLTPFPHSKTQKEKSEEISLLNTLNPPPGDPGAAVAWGTMWKLMPPQNSVKAVEASGATVPPQCKRKMWYF